MGGTTMRNIILLLIAAAAVGGCNTMAGLGKDVEAAGEAIQRGARK